MSQASRIVSRTSSGSPPGVGDGRIGINVSRMDVLACAFVCNHKSRRRKKKISNTAGNRRYSMST